MQISLCWCQAVCSVGHSAPGTAPGVGKGQHRKKVKAIVFCGLTSLPMGNHKANLVVINKLFRDLWLRCAGMEPGQVTRKCPPRGALGWSLITVQGLLGHKCDSTGDLLPFQGAGSGSTAGQFGMQHLEPLGAPRNAAGPKLCSSNTSEAGAGAGALR